MPGSVSVWVKSGGNNLGRKNIHIIFAFVKKFMMVFENIIYI